MGVDLSKLWDVFVEPKHKMYLNGFDDCRCFWDTCVEPKHKMYLNRRKLIMKIKQVNVEPKHKMYLNLYLRSSLHLL